MLLFVVSTLVVFHFAVPGASDRAALGPALGRAPLRGAPRPRPRLRRGAGAAPSRRARPCALRSERDLARQGARRPRLPRRARARRAAGLRALLRWARRQDGRGGRARGHRDLRRRDAALRHGRRCARPRAAAAAALPAARPADRHRRCRREPRRRGLATSPSSRCTTCSLRHFAGAPSNMSSLSSRLPTLAVLATGLLALGFFCAFFVAPTTPTRASPTGSSTRTSRSCSPRTPSSSGAPGRRSATSRPSARTTTSRAMSRSISG